MLITFVKSIQVEAFRTDGTSWTTRIDAAYGEFYNPAGRISSGDIPTPPPEGMVNLALYEGLSNQRDGSISRFGLSKLLPNVAKILRSSPCEARSKLLDDWGTSPPEKKWEPRGATVRQDNIRSVVDA